MTTYVLVLSDIAESAVIQSSIFDRMAFFSSMKHVEPYSLACCHEVIRPVCALCNGTGTRLSTWNPYSKWETFVAGGGLDGWMTNSEPQGADERCNFFLNTTKVAHVPNRVIQRLGYIMFTPLAPNALYSVADATNARQVLSTRGDLLATLYATHGS